jgi:hypothetical protein
MVQIFADVNGTRRTAYKVGGKAYKVFPSGTNLSRHAKEFRTVEEAADFLRKNPGWGIRMNPGAAIIYENVRIV